MYRIKSTTTLLLSLALSTACAFAPRAPSSSASGTVVSSSSSTVLYISSWGTKGPPAFRQTERGNPEEYVQDYLPEAGPVEARANIDGTLLVSGCCNAKDRTDQFLFDLLNHQDSAFEFEKIVAFVNDVKLAKKRLLSRSARYTGLLDKLDFMQAEDDDTAKLPTSAQLQGVKSWLAVLETPNLEHCTQIAATAASVDSLENVAILLQNANELDAAACQTTVDALKSSGKQYTIVAVGKIEDRPEGQNAYHYAEFGSTDAVLPAKAVFSREESYRMITELLQLESGVNKALTFAEVYNVNVTEARLIKGLREAGYARPQEIDHMIREGPKAYKEAVEKFKKENPDAAKGYTTNAWWEAEEYQKSRQRSDERAAAKLEVIKDERTKEIEEVAKEWAKREYFRQSMAGTVENDMTEDEFTKTVWDRAMLEGDMKYRIAKGEVVDEETEVADFKKMQERKQETMLKKAKKELAELLEEDVENIDPAANMGSDDDKK